MGKKGPNPNFKYKANPSKGIKKLIEQVSVSNDGLQEIRKDVGKEADRAIKEELQTYIDTFQAMLIEHRVMKNILMKLLGLDIKEWNEIYLEEKNGDILR